MKNTLYFLFFLPFLLCAKQVDTFYGPIEVEEPVLLELIDSPAFQRLKNIHQYGVAYYTSHQEEYNRFDHSIGVFAILRARGGSIEEQIAGLLHDVSHTVFSHVGDWVFSKQDLEKDYQNEIHPLFLVKSGLADILEKHHFTVEQVLPEEALFPALESSLPNLCADRIDYNIQGAYYQGFISHEEAVSIFKDLKFTDNRWVSTQPELMKKLSRFSCYMTQTCWGSPENHMKSQWLADSILRGIEIECLSWDDLHFGEDQNIWEKLLANEDPIIQEKMFMILNCEDYISLVDISDDPNFLITSKFRGINPWVLVNSKYERITSLDEDLAKEYEQNRLLVEKGWPIKLKSLHPCIK
jgi:uncharacterized protein